MPGFGEKFPSAVEAKEKAQSPDLQNASAKDARKNPEQAKTGLVTPENTPGPDAGRLEADEARRQAEAAKISSKEASAEEPSDQAAAPKMVGKGKDEAGKPSETAPSGSSETPTGAGEEFASNAQGEEEPEDEMMQDSAPTPNNFHEGIYNEALPYLATLENSPEDKNAISNLQNLNVKIRKKNIEDGLPKNDHENFCIQIDTFIAHFQLAKLQMEALQENPADDKARENLELINRTMRQLNKRHGYPDTWVIQLPPKPYVDGTKSTAVDSSGAAASNVANKPDKSSTKGGVKTKVGVPIPDESDGLTSLGKVVYVRKAGHGSRVIVNRGTDENPYFEVHPGAAFGKGVAKEWLEEGGYKCKDLPDNTTAKQITIYGRVKVERTAHQRITKTGRTNSQIQYYLSRIGDEKYISTRSALSGMKGLSPAKLQRIDAQLDRQNEQLLAELDQCREGNEHPDTGEQLTKSDIEGMPWLSLDAIVDTQNEDSGDEDEDEDIGDIVDQRVGLKRNSKPKSAGTPTTKDSKSSTV